MSKNNNHVLCSFLSSQSVSQIWAVSVVVVVVYAGLVSTKEGAGSTDFSATSLAGTTVFIVDDDDDDSSC